MPTVRSRATSSGLPQGFQNVVAVVVGQPDSAAAARPRFVVHRRVPHRSDGARRSPVPRSWRAARRCRFPTVPRPTSRRVPSLTTLTLNVVDPVNQAYTTLVTPSTVIFDALNPTTAENISNYSLINTSENDEDESAYILTATYVADSSHAQSPTDRLTSWPTTATST